MYFRSVKKITLNDLPSFAYFLLFIQHKSDIGWLGFLGLFNVLFSFISDFGVTLCHLPVSLVEPSAFK